MNTPQSSNPFRHLAKEQCLMIEDAYKAGKTPEQIGIKFGLDYDDVRFYLENFVVPPRSHFERLSEIVDDLEDQCEKTKLSIDNGSDSAMMLQSYQRLMSEYRLALAECAGLQRPQEVVDEIIEKVFKPFVTSLIRSCTEETSNLKQEMIKLDVPIRDAQGISIEIFKRLAERIQALLPEAHASLDSHFGVKKTERGSSDSNQEKSTLQ